jgi:Lysyl oxidase
MGFKLRFTPALIAAAGLIAGSAVAVSAPASAAPAGWPVVKLYAPQLHKKIAVYGGGQSFIDPSIYVESRGSALQFDVQRKSFADPITITQIIKSGNVSERRPLGSWALDSWRGLRRFFRLTIKDSHGKVLSSKTYTFCPNSYGPQRATPDSPSTSPYPTSCSYSTPFLIGGVWGIAKGWAVDPMQSGFVGLNLKLKVGQTYTATMSITKAWRGVLRMGAHNATATVKLQAVKPSQCNPCTFRTPAKKPAGQSLASQLHETAAKMQQVPLLTNPPRSVLPDLKPLPSWGIILQNQKAKSGKITSLLDFGATVAVLGNGPLDVEGFSTHHASVMPAYQYYWRGTKVVGRTRAGTMGFDNKKGHNHWHFEQFAQYRLLGSNKKLVVTSHKVGFCIAPTDGVDLVIKHAIWQPSYTGFTGECGAPGALWVQEQMPVGWGDTYFQYVAGQSFDINSIPNGTYYIEIVANPEGVLHELSTANDISYRKIILGGTRGHRTVRVPAVDGIDPE